MTVQEAIEHERKVAEENRQEAIECEECSKRKLDKALRLDKVHKEDQYSCEKCAEEHEQLVQWLEELEQYRALGTVEELKDAREKQSKADWIPFKQREADEEEKAHFLEHYGYELEYMLCGRLPDEDEEILVTYSNGCVGEDIFLRDGTECYLDSGQEIVTEAIAWMPKPQPYKKEGAENELL